MNGFETRELCEAQIAALERERRGHIRDARHLAVIDAQLDVYRAELARLEAEGEPEDPNKNRRGRADLIKSLTTGKTYQQWIN
jgi:hypothetical protein